jgi:hypothetical protein
VSARDHEEISEEDRRYENGDRADLLDVVRVPMLEPRPHTYQTENHLIDEQCYWSKEGRADWALLTSSLDNHLTTLWQNGYSSYSGINDRVPLALANAENASLAFIAVDQVSVLASAEGIDFGDMKRKVRARWVWRGNQYAVRVTDPEIERLALSNLAKACELGSAYICVSLGEPYNDFAYKLAAAIITPTRV